MQRTIYIGLILLLLRYRRTVLGPLWLIVGPALFIIVLGALYAQIGGAPTEVFVPHLTVGLVVWTLAQGFINGASGVYVRNRAQILQTAGSLHDIARLEVVNTVLSFLHQSPLIIAVFIFYGVAPSWTWLLAPVGIAVAIINGLWITQVFGILGARYRDLTEIFQALMRIAFLATPIIWLPDDTFRGGSLSAFLDFNPFYHFIEIIRAPLLGQLPTTTTVLVVAGITIAGLLLGAIIQRRYKHLVPLWI